MRLHGTIEENLRAAITSARRLRGHPIHSDTVRHWSDLLDHARRKLDTGEALDRETLAELLATLGALVAEHTT
jgi:hypothetical protein